MSVGGGCAGGVIVLVMGSMTKKDQAARRFVQTFFLARQQNTGA